jgi:hypothetical protein
VQDTDTNLQQKQIIIIAHKARHVSYHPTDLGVFLPMLQDPLREAKRKTRQKTKTKDATKKKTWVPDCVEEAAVISRDDSSHKHSTVLHIYSLLVLCPRSFLYLLCAPRLQKIYFEENHRLGYPTTTIP